MRTVPAGARSETTAAGRAGSVVRCNAATPTAAADAAEAAVVEAHCDGGHAAAAAAEAAVEA
jgi:hypothetical protein